MNVYYFIKELTKMDKPIDTLTGLISGVELYSEMEKLIAKGGEFALIVLDIDGLFVLNRDYGHEAGDAVFCLIAKQIRSVFSEPCIAFRDTRDQFDVLMPESGKEKAFLQAEQLRRLINDEKLLPKTSHYTQAQLEKLTLVAKRINVGEAALLREALDDLLKKYDIDDGMKNGKG